MTNIKAYIIAFLSGCAVVLLGICVYLLRNSKPVINADTFIESMEQTIKKLKQSGDGNSATVTPTIEVKIEDKAPDSLVEWIRKRREAKTVLKFKKS